MAKAPPSARAVALDLMSAVLVHRTTLNDALESEPGLNALTSRDRAFARLMVTTCLRRLGQIDEILGSALEKPQDLRVREVRDILRLGVAQLVFLATPPHAAVDNGVRLAEARGHRAFMPLVNAVLRRVSVEGAEWAASQDAARLNTPGWLWRSWEKAFGLERARAIARLHLLEPPLDLTCKANPENWAKRLGAQLLPTGTLRLEKAGSVGALEGFDEGAWWVQDAAAALPARLLGEVRGLRVIDLCAAPGGKTAQLAARGAKVIAVERSGKRLARLGGNLARLGLEAELVEADAASWKPGAPAEAVLLDAPCTATGTIRRHPDVPWLKDRPEVARMAAMQSRLLEGAAEMVAPGGILVYSVCSLEREECEARIEALLQGRARFERVPVSPDEVGGFAELVTEAGDLRTLPCHLEEWGGLDGFYAVRLRRIG